MIKERQLIAIWIVNRIPGIQNRSITIRIKVTDWHGFSMISRTLLITILHDVTLKSK